MIPGPRPGRPLDPVKSTAIIDATLGILDEYGYAALTMEGVARRAGIAKTTLYRRYPNKVHLVSWAVFAEPNLGPQDPTATLHDDLDLFVHEVVIAIGNPAAAEALPGLLADTRWDEDLARIFRQTLVDGRNRRARSIVKAAVARGELPRDTKPDTLMDLVAGAVLFRTLVTRAPLTAADRERLATAVERALTR